MESISKLNDSTVMETQNELLTALKFAHEALQTLVPTMRPDSEVLKFIEQTIAKAENQNAS